MSKKKNRTSPAADRATTEGRPAPHSAFPIPHSTFFILGLFIVIVVYVAHCAYYWAYVNDDAYITFRYSRFLAMGRGPYYNLGEHVEGYTNFLLMLVLTPIIGFFGETAAAPFAKSIGVASGGLAIIAIAGLVRHTFQRKEDSPTVASFAGLLATGLIAVDPSYALNSTSGLETMLFAGTLSFGLLLGHHSVEQARWRGAGIAFACAALTRPEGILFFAVYWLAQLVTIRKASPSATFRISNSAFRILLIDALIVSGVFASHLIFRLIAYDGEWLPNTYYAKAGGFWKVGAAPYIRTGALKPFFDTYGIGVGIAVIGWLFSGSTRRATFPLFCIASVGTLLPFVTGSDWMLGFRLLMPFLPAVAGVVAIGWCRIASFLLRQPRWLGPPLVLVSLPMLWYLHGDFRTYFHDHVQMRARGYETGHTALAKWLRAGAAQPGDTVALMDIGIVGFLCTEQNILDITGLTDRTIAKSAGEFMRKQFDPAYVLERKPKFIVLVFGANGNPDAPPPAGTRLKPWSINETKIWTDPDFKKIYVHRRPTPKAATHWTDDVAAIIGAERVFEHTHPGQYYLLAAFHRADGVTPTGGPVPATHEK